ncbi:hypothetical protein HY358_01495 [Candidatus Roizmanbacteria bacterium]|nr:hypothetical protein [Candidatus Roizmanbacteria bacterium]
MRHKSKKIKIRFGKDANKMLMRKLAVNFIGVGKITTTSTKAKSLKSYLERLVEKAKKDSQANRNYLLKNLADPKVIRTFVSSVGTQSGERTGGYITAEKLHQRDNDGALMVRLQWSAPIPKEQKV